MIKIHNFNKQIYFVTAITPNKRIIMSELKNLPETTFSYVKLVQALEKKYKIVDISTTALELEEVIYNLYKEYEL